MQPPEVLQHWPPLEGSVAPGLAQELLRVRELLGPELLGPGQERVRGQQPMVPVDSTR